MCLRRDFDRLVFVCFLLFLNNQKQVPLTEHIVKGDGKVSLIVRDAEGRARVVPEVVRVIERVVHKPGVVERLAVVWRLCRDALLTGRSVLVFCGTRGDCSECAKEAMLRIQAGDAALKHSLGLADAKLTEVRDDALARLTRSSSGANRSLCDSLTWSVAFHHAGLTDEERKQVERVYRCGGVRLLFATSTLAVGVNLPASVVIQLGFKAGGELIECSTYMQMAGRAGRAGQDAAGEAFLVLGSDRELTDATEVLQAGPKMLVSALVPPKLEQLKKKKDSDKVRNNLPRFLLDVIGRGIVPNVASLEHYIAQTLRWSVSSQAEREEFIREVQMRVRELQAAGSVVCVWFVFFFCGERKRVPGYFVVMQSGLIVLRPLAIATSVTWLRPDESRKLLTLVEEAMTRGFVMLGTNLHYAFLISPLECDRFLPKGANIAAECIKKCSNQTRRLVLSRVIGFDSFATFETQVLAGHVNELNLAKLEKLYCAMVICDMIDEKELFDVAAAYGMEVKDVEALMESSSVQASQVQSFLELLGAEYRGLGAAIGEFIPRLERGIKVKKTKNGVLCFFF